MKKDTKKAAYSSKITRKENSGINLMLSAHSKAFLKDFKAVLPPRLLSLLRHNLCGLSDEMQQFVCDNVVTFLHSRFMFKSGVTHVDQRQGLLMIEMMNASGINYPPF